MEFGIIGTSIWQQNVPLMERLTLDRESKDVELQRLKDALGLGELVYLATCNRVEFIYVTSGDLVNGRLFHRLLDHFFHARKDISFFPNDFYHFTGKDAITHLFRTAASLESLVVGETQITGQIKQALQESQENDLVGSSLTGLINEALLVAKTVKRETSIGVGALSMASLATNELHASLQAELKPVIALVGAGPMTRKLAAHIKDTNLGSILFVNRTVEKAESLGQEFGGVAVSLEEFVARPARVHAIVSSTASQDPVFDAAFIERLPEIGAKIVCIDLAIPRDFSTDLMACDKIFLADIPYLKSRGNGNLRQKFVEAGKANEIVREAVNQYLSDRVELTLKPIFHDSYRESMELAWRALDNLFNEKLTHLGDDDREAVTRLVTKLIGHSSFQPVKTLSGRLAAISADLPISDLSDLRREAV